MVTQPKIVLHQWLISPFCGKVRKVLALKGLAYDVVEYGGVRALQVKRLSHAGKLPILDYAGERFADSSVIARMLEARHPEPSLYPARPRERQLAHLLEDWADESLYWFELWSRFCDPVARERAVALFCEGRPAYERSIVRLGMRPYQRAVKVQGLGRYPDAFIRSALLEHLAALDGLLAEGPWLVGERASIADIAVSAQLDEFARTSTLAHELGAFPRLVAWLERCDFQRNATPRIRQEPELEAASA